MLRITEKSSKNNLKEDASTAYNARAAGTTRLKTENRNSRIKGAENEGAAAP